MEALQIVDMVKKLPLVEKLRLVELIFKDIKEETLGQEREKEALKKSAEIMLDDYRNSEELTAFSSLDAEGFYETK